MLTQEQSEKNKQKYGNKEDDVISRAYREDKRIGDIWCAKNVEKYLRRFISKSEKSNNRMDLLKAQDYLQRMLVQNQDLNTFEIQEIEESKK